jgi:hypothetical protein
VIAVDLLLKPIATLKSFYDESRDMKDTQKDILLCQSLNTFKGIHRHGLFFNEMTSHMIYDFVAMFFTPFSN